MPSIFSKIISGDIPCYKVAEDDLHLAFLDISPVVKGHVLVIPKKEVDYMYDMTEDAFIQLQLFARTVAKAMDRTFDCDRIGVMVMGLEVPHTHIHLMPINTPSDMDFTKKKLSLTNEEMTEVATLINNNL